MSAAPLTTLGLKLEKHSVFPDGVNAEFVQVLGERELRLRIWERGSGVTTACGTGTCASVVAAISKNYCFYDTPITVHLDSGTLVIRIAPDNAVIENFFGLFKSELLYLQEFQSMEHFKQEQIEYLDYYNSRRIKAKLKGLLPAIHRQQALSAA